LIEMVFLNDLFLKKKIIIYLELVLI